MSSTRSGPPNRTSEAKGTPSRGTESDSPSKTAAPNPVATAAPAGANRRRLGRGLSSLLNEAIAVSAPPPPTPVQARPASAPAVSPVREAVADESDASKASVVVPERARGDEEPGGTRVVSLAIGAIVPSPFQPRRVFDHDALERLAASIRTAGVMQPILVRRRGGAAGGVGGVGGFELVAGERRWRAAQLAGLEAVPAIVAELGDEQAAEWALIENVQREELGAMERAWALRSLVERFGLTHGDAAEKVGLDRSSVSNLIRLTELEEPIRVLLEEGKLGVGHGKALLAAPAGPGRVALARRAAEGGWSVRRLERAAPAAAQAVSGGPAGEVPSAEDEERRLAARARELGHGELERQLGEHLGTKVHVRTGRGGSRGRLIVEFYDLDHFDGLMTRIGFQIR